MVKVEVIKEIYCKKCGANTKHQFKYHIMDIQEEKEANELALRSASQTFLVEVFGVKRQKSRGNP
ncbi:MAG: hypothetical protein KAT28_01535 [Candidatus Aenigmarchaeota archaeon]|nr:hypothetical protein [Candidatus Aenigmarchaeota archaeon]